MRTPVKLLFDNLVVADLELFSYETPWATANALFRDRSLAQKLIDINNFDIFCYELEERELPEDEEEAIWSEKLRSLGLTFKDLEMNKDEHWSVECDDGTIDEVRAIQCYSNGLVKWRA